MTDRNGVPDEMVAAIEGLVLAGALDEGYESHREQLYAEPEWAVRRYTHQASLLQSFVQGIMTADSWHHGYRLPPHFEGVVNMVAFEIQRRWPTEVPQVSLVEFERFLRETCPLHPEFVKWNETTELVGIVTRYSEMANARDFIDLDALFRNAAVALRDHRRRDDAFDAKFAATHPEFAAPEAR